jgi:thiol-disulfide isomerase/thioredoxin
MALLLLSGVPAFLLSACDRQSKPPEQANAAAQISADEVSPDEVKSEGDGKKDGFNFSVDRTKAGTAAPDFAFAAPGGGEVRLKDFAGKPVLVNLWATWCAPCVAEMPTLDGIAGDYSKQGLQVLTISQDTQVGSVTPFFQRRAFKHIKAWRDPENRFGFFYATGVLPTSVLYDAKGKEVARVVGAMDWRGQEAKALLAQAF